ncbi:MAG TPA: Lrp/AsnC family transcriptional regulator [Candidatus Dormibacteraeota bacterium]|nr:Lrp/AsnC family transcriptional regulator [Candidatus Dormibacteraeota bacterium]
MTFDSPEQLDPVDWKLLELLQEDARLTFAELGRRVLLSAPAVAERVRRLEQAGVLTGYHAEVDIAKLGFPMQAVIRIIASARLSEQLAPLLQEIPEILECQRVTGQDSFVVRVAIRSVENLEDVLRRLAPHDGDTITSVILNTPVRHRVITREVATAGTAT